MFILNIADKKGGKTHQQNHQLGLQSHHNSASSWVTKRLRFFYSPVDITFEETPAERQRGRKGEGQPDLMRREEDWNALPRPWKRLSSLDG